MADAPRSSPLRSSEAGSLRSRFSSPLFPFPVFLVFVLLLAQSMMVVSVPSYAALPYTERTIDKRSSSSSEPTFYDAAAEDLDDDGDTDVVAATGEAVVWYDNLGTDTDFSRDTVALTTSSTRLVHPRDFDEDGDLDVVAGSQGAVQWFENDGSETFTGHTVASDGVKDFDVVDFDRDGDLDVVAATSDGTDAFVWYENDGTDLGFTRHEIDVGRNPSAVHVKDVDGDGDRDVATADRGADEFAWHQNDGTHTGFTKHSIAVGEPEADTAVDIEMTDVNGDGRPDAVLLTSTHSYLGPCGSLEGLNYTDGGFVAVELKGKGETDFTRVYEYSGGSVYQELETGDLDEDGDPDVLSVDVLDGCDGKSAGYEWHENQGAGHFRQQTLQRERGAYGITRTDFDGRKGPDLLTVRRDSSLDPGEFSWFENVNHFPVANFSFVPTKPSVGESISFTDESSDSDGTIERWRWSFGNGDTSTLQHPSYSYRLSGHYVVRLTVEDDNATRSTLGRPLFVDALTETNQDDCGSGVDAGGDPSAATTASSASGCFSGDSGRGQLISADGDTSDYYRFPVTFGDTIRARLTPDQVVCPNHDLRLYGPDGRLRGTSRNFDCATDSLTVEADQSGDSGDWFLEADYVAGADTTYRLTVDVTFNRDFPPDCGIRGDAGDDLSTATPKVETRECFDGFEGEGELDPDTGDREDFYSFPVFLGDAVEVTMDPGGGSCPNYDFLLYDPSGTVRASPNEIGCQKETATVLANQPSDSGTWVLEIDGTFQPAGTYDLTVQVSFAGSQSDCGSRYDAGDTHSAALLKSETSECFDGIPGRGKLVSDSGDFDDYYQFPVRPGDAVEATVVPNQTECPDHDLYLYDPSGTLRSSSLTTGTFTCDPESLTDLANITGDSGDWFLRVAYVNGADTDYELTADVHALKREGPDSYPDLLVSGSINPGREASVFSNTTDTSFIRTHELLGYDTGVQGSSVDVADYNQDGLMDLVVSGKSGSGISASGEEPPRHLIVFRNEGDGTFTNVAEPLGEDTGVFDSSVRWSDVDQDGLPDLVVGGWVDSYTSILAVFHNNGDGSFTKVAELRGASSRINYSIALADYNGDSFPDLAVSDGTLEVFRNEGDQSFTSVATPLGADEGLSGSSIHWSDIDRDGDPDLVVSGQAGSTYDYNHRLIVFRNNGDGTFTNAAEPMGSGQGVSGSSIDLGDFDNDGFPDLAVSGEDNDGNPRLIVFRNDQSGSFIKTAQPMGADTGVAYGSIQWGDYDRDGFLDLAVSGRSPSGPVLKIFRNDQGETLTSVAEPLGIGAGVDLSSVHWGNITGDPRASQSSSGDVRSGTGGGGGSCLIDRTAPMSWTKSLRDLRDAFLLRSVPGRTMVRTYYRWIGPR